MKKILALLLVLATVFALAACGDTKEAEVLQNVDPGDNSVVIETPPAIVSGPDTPVDQYPSVSALPTTAPTTVPSVEPSAVPVPTTEPGANNGNTGNTGNTGDNNGGNNNNNTNNGGDNFEYADPTGESYNATATQDEKKNAKTGYINAEWVNFRVGPGSQYKIYESLPKGAEVKVLGYTDNGWAKIWYNEYLVGYVAKNYVSEQAPSDDAVVVTETPTPTETPVPTVVVIAP